MAVVSNGALFPLSMEYSWPDQVVSVIDAFGAVPFEQRSPIGGLSIVVFGRPAVGAVEVSYAIGRWTTNSEERTFIVRRDGVPDEDIEIPFTKGLDGHGVLTQLRHCVAEVCGLTAATCDLSVVLRSGRIAPISRPEDLKTMAATNVVIA